MDRPDALAAYIRELRKERDAWLYQHALNKVRVITRSMQPAEKEEYLRSDSFRNTLRQLQRRDRIYQGLLRHELVQPGAKAECDRLSRLIAGELQAGRKVDLAFLRTVKKSHVSLDKAYRAVRTVLDGSLRHYYDENVGSLTVRAENRIVVWMRTGDPAARLPEDDSGRSVVRRLLEASFPGGLTARNTEPAFRPGTLESFLRREAEKAYPELSACRNIRLPSGEAVATYVRRETERGERLVLSALNRKFPRERSFIYIRWHALKFRDDPGKHLLTPG